ncbi:MAG: hypothetical protein ACD_17C00166G0004 [uncultured bacterium]|nr:MAG: hypothetical protein ACD_17C00166G0004 [uncultured bacterium]OGN56658.1 MAG: hypothetical protein A2796_03760 [Chlamydiae bacterium RIFCSPHIGHO2_01_FULL_44_39]OGN58114.1 MAG: hypothetical protein A3C42_00420 [Chlamydiae bacterium RIFCSPHIGHO2_02_FULL_45_9]OGN61166.1 MAG: hypothetical protein A3D96_05935 [Chlamydiae bacterium RIFCSPHIGHO2_12_FULL_44_59]OGN65636.1 MAG: hypothetical protein A2978_06740 [Chlamydiae bacterium RIFCSPLOWO2_01_FULL_44_52]OGN68113.1 MAG: hypothetical protein A3
MRALALNTGMDIHLLDHIAPLAALLDIPLWTTEEPNYLLARQFYPQVKVEYMPDLEYRLGEIAHSYDTLFECKYWQAHLKQLFKDFYQKEMTLVFCPHGQSDKGFQFPLLAPYSIQDAVLVYGPLMLEMLNELQIPLKQSIMVGNYRLKFYRTHQSFYDNLLKKRLPLDPKKRTILYAPTWKDADDTVSFFQFGKKVLAELPQDWNLILKVHPLLKERTPVEYYRTLLYAESKHNVFVLEDYPPVYPVLAASDIYLGDFSSVGYDFLTFEKPLFFLPTDRPTRLYSCGQILNSNENFYTQMENPKKLVNEQRKLRKWAYSEGVDTFSMGGKIKTVCKSFK